MLIYNELPICFPWYDKEEKQQRHRENAKQACDYRLICPTDALLPFQIRLPSDQGAVTSWVIVSGCGTEINIFNNLSQIERRDVNAGVYYIYKGGQLKFMRQTVAEPLKLSPGKYYSRIEFGLGSVYYSEVFTVPNDSFEKDDASNYMKLEFWNDHDIEPIMYNDGNEGHFKQVMYVDTFIHASEPEIEEDGERDGNDQIVPTFQRMVVKYRFSTVVPDYLKIAIVSMQMHDNVYLTTEKSIRNGRVERMTSSSTIEQGGSYSTVDVILEQVVLVKSACGQNMI